MCTRGPGALKRNSNIARPVMVRPRSVFAGFTPCRAFAGQQPQYIENQLRAFLERRRLNPVMANVAHGITPDMIPALAASMSALNPPPVGGAPTGDAALGKEIFADGLPDQNVPACSACHGPDARGQREIPRLAGQLYWYMVSTLSLWSSERGQGGRQDISWIMRPTVANLTPKQVRALAEYVSVPIPTKPPVCNGMIAPREPPVEMIPPGAPRSLA